MGIEPELSMHGFRQSKSRYWFLLAIVAVVTVGPDGLVFGQEKGTTPPKDAIAARKTLMVFISDAMDKIEKMIAAGKIDVAAGTKQADQISVMLGAFPHLFPAGTNQWKPNEEPDPVTDTLAAPELWEQFPDFYSRARAASEIAFKLSRTKKEEDFRAGSQQLRAACDGCHAAYMKQ
jgi:cytochrome c556